MPQTKAGRFPQLFRPSDRSPLLLSLVFSIAFGLALLLGSLGKFAGDEFSQFSVPRSFFELAVRARVFGHPIERMVPELLATDRQVAVYLLAIAKKESNWGKISPQKNGRTCFNYWGYRGSENPTDSGYSCFASRGEAVSIVGARIRELLDSGVDTPREFVVWKRGFLTRPLDVSEEKWVNDVSRYVDIFSSPTRRL